MATLRVSKGPYLDVFEVDREVEIGRELLEVGDGVDVVALFRVAHRGAAGGGLGQRGFDLDHRVGFLGGLLRANRRRG